MSDSTILLLDYDNAATVREVAPRDTRLNLAPLFSSVRAAILEYRLPKDVSVRLYGGWHFDDGRMTPRAEWLLRALPDFRGLEKGVRIKPDLASSVAAASGRHLLGTYRNSSGPEQKMVDTMIVADAIYYARRHNQCVVVLSDDSDITPGLVVGGRECAPGNSIVWLRTATRKASANDSLISMHCELRTWTT